MEKIKIPRITVSMTYEEAEEFNHIIDHFLTPAEGIPGNGDINTCPICGKEIFRNDNFCSYCGKKVEYNEADYIPFDAIEAE